jgi:hypothetical protein
MFVPKNLMVVKPNSPTPHCTRGLAEVSVVSAAVTVIENGDEDIAVFSVDVAVTLTVPAVVDETTPAVVTDPPVAVKVAKWLVLPSLWLTVAVQVDVCAVVIDAGVQVSATEVTVTGGGGVTLLDDPPQAVRITATTERNADANTVVVFIATLHFQGGRVS